jgi:hypothetical protein
MNLKQNDEPLVLLYIDDLIFTSKISILAKKTGVKTRSLTNTDLDSLDDLIAISKLILVDLNANHLKPLEFIKNVLASPTGRDVRIICFVSHVHYELKKEAEKFEKVTVFSRSQFVDALEGILKGIKDI